MNKRSAKFTQHVNNSQLPSVEKIGIKNLGGSTLYLGGATLYFIICQSPSTRNRIIGRENLQLLYISTKRGSVPVPKGTLYCAFS
jgi:hypothetical protein